ncbi:DUF6918 family protein [Polyangium aurulentum]|uniref:DUF6918 family protein n=1 Tax=Polyangium aurulentum TaxID=2567896 RepID=UPI0010ADAC37|nr:hypothetical protein E8A73_015390 [Polyangium aurulentum]
MGLTEALADNDKRASIVAECATLIDDEVGSKSGLSSLPLKAGYAAVKGIKPGFIPHVIEHLLPEFATKLDPIWTEGVSSGNASKFFQDNRSRVADALLSVTDAKAKNAKSGLVRSTYDKLRGTAKKHVEEAVPRLSKVLERYA